MTGDWLRPFELLVPFSEFERLPRNSAYKYEYFGGRAVLTPRPRYQQAMLDLAAVSPPASLCAGMTFRPLEAGDWTLLPELLAAAFRTVLPLVTLEVNARLAVARLCVEHTRAGGDGPVVEPACFVAVDPNSPACLTGAVIITLVSGGHENLEAAQRPHLTWILVHPWRFARGLGTALLAHAATALQGLGYEDLASTFLVGNDRATLWHWRGGFRLVPDALPLSPLSRRERGTGGEDAEHPAR